MPDQRAGVADPKCERCGHLLHRYRDLTLCQECEDAARAELAASDLAGFESADPSGPNRTTRRVGRTAVILARTCRA